MTATDTRAPVAEPQLDRPQPPKSAFPRRRFTELDGLRGVAALVVVLFHLRRTIEELHPPAEVDTFLDGGYLMVDLFFALSGFVLATSMLATATAADVGRFSSLRIRRFMPLHLTGWVIAALCMLTIGVLQLFGTENAPSEPAFTTYNQTEWAWLSSALLLQGFLGPNLAGYPAAWSLSIELWTNVLLVVAIALVPARRLKQLVGPASLAVGAIILLTADPAAENTIGVTAFGRGLTGLGLGMVVYQLYQAAERRRAVDGESRADDSEHRADDSERRRAVDGDRLPRWPSVGAGLGLIALVACMYWAPEVRERQFLPMAPVAAVLLLCLAWPSSGMIHRTLNSRFLQWLGSRSFALYALHGSVLMAVVLACQLRGLDFDARRVNAFVVVSVLAGSLLAAEIGHRFIERAWTDTLRTPGRRRT